MGAAGNWLNNVFDRGQASANIVIRVIPYRGAVARRNDVPRLRVAVWDGDFHSCSRRAPAPGQKLAGPDQNRVIM